MSDASVRSTAFSAFSGLIRQKRFWPYLAAVFVYLVISRISGNAEATLAASMSFASFFILVGIGQMLVITTGPGNIDLSIPYTIALAGLIAMKTMNEVNANILMGFAAGIAAGAVIGVVNYILIRLILMPPMIATLSSSFIVRTLSIVFFRGLQIKPPTALARFANAKIAGAPVIFLIVLCVAALMAAVLARSRYGRSIHAIGQNMRAAWLSNISVMRVKLLTYMLCGIFAAATGVLLSGFIGGATLDMGDEYMMYSIAVVVLGGSSIAGGDSNVSGIVGASLFLYLLVNLLNIMGLGISLRNIITGLIIIAIIFIGGERASKKS
ncbi:MAG: ABC transporter permease [Synergistaceae bacterium]|jgi:ribose transport system permease protein|nr:ABC transporter permease [Synergistaceae bacterium]